MKSLKNKKWVAVIVGIFCLILVGLQHFNVDLNVLIRKIVPVNIVEHSKDYPMNVHVINVGKADSILITCNDKNILIDAADKDVTNSVVDYLTRESVKKLDLVIATHPHCDHIGQMSDVVNKFQIDRFIMPKLEEGVMSITKTYENLLLALKNKNISPEQPVAGKDFEIGDMKIEILAPIKEYDNVNNHSVVTKISYGERSFLFTGDAEKESEKDMLNFDYDLHADVLKVGHHGSKTSTSKKFLDAVRPKYAVISVADDKNNLPKKEILNRLFKYKVQVFRTDVHGTVIFSTDGKNIEVFKEKE